VGSIAAGVTILQNAARGSAFETAGIAALNDAIKNTTRIEVPGIARGSIRGSSITEFKNAIEVNYTLQNEDTGCLCKFDWTTTHLIVSPTTQRIVLPCRKQSLVQVVQFNASIRQPRHFPPF